MKRFGFKVPDNARPIYVNGNKTSLEEMRHHAEQTAKRARKDGDYELAGMADCIVALLDRVDAMEELLPGE